MKSVGLTVAPHTSSLQACALSLGCLALLACALLVSGRQPFTGDEPRYFFYALSFAKTYGFHLPASEWFSFLQSHGLGDVSIYPDTPRPGHSVVIPILASPLAASFGLAGVRFFSFVCMGAAIWCTAGLIRRECRPLACFVALCVAYVSLPAAPYAASFYSEAALAGLLSAAWYAVTRQRERDGFPLLALLLIFALPFFHLRLAPAAAVLGAILVLDQWRQGLLHLSRLFGLALLVAAALGAFTWYQTSLFGSFLGSATAPHPMRASLYLDRLILQLFDLRHGLIAVAPAALLALAGLVRALLDGRRLGLEAVSIGLALTLAFVWGVASESMPGRFWVGMAPVLCVGLALFLNEPKTLAAKLWTVFLLGLQACVLLVWLSSPGPFINGRTASLVWDIIYDHVGLFHLGSVLPWDPTEFDPARHALEAAKAWPLFWFSLLVALSLALCAEQPSRSHRPSRVIGSLSAMFLLGVFFWWTGCQTLPIKVALPRVTALEADPSQVSAYPDKTLSIEFARPVHPALVRLGCRHDDFGQDGFPVRFDITAQTGQPGEQRSIQIQATDLLRLGDFTEVRKLEITPTAIKKAPQSTATPPFRPWNVPPLVDVVAFRFR